MCLDRRGFRRWGQIAGIIGMRSWIFYWIERASRWTKRSARRYWLGCRRLWLPMNRILICGMWTIFAYIGIGSGGDRFLLGGTTIFWRRRFGSRRGGRGKPRLERFVVTP